MAKITNSEDDRRIRQNQQNNIRGAKETKADRIQRYKNNERFKYETKYEFNRPKKSAGEGTGKVTKIRAAKAGGRAQPKGTPPRTGPGSGGQNARYARLTGGLLKHGR